MPANYIQRHRTDIDGLRALAILPVLLFHAKLGCPGGYVGVDIFFVISGYLITSLILKEQAAGTFTLVSFWERRVRRIVPAMAFMLAGTFLLGWFIFLPDDFQLMAKSAIAQAAMMSNVFFYEQMIHGNGYFGPTADTQPLLHTWSLSVEEQFYLLFPILIVLAAKRRMLLRAVTAVWLLSFLISIWYFVPPYFDPVTIVMNPGPLFRFIFSYWHRVALLDSPSQAGYFLVTARAWELLLGAILILTRGRFVPDRGARELMGWLGLGMIVYAIFCYDDKTPFPGVAALLPCVGAALIISANEVELCLIGRLLSLKPFVFIGLISYSLYLWHWPLLVFYKYPCGTEPGPWRRVAVLAAAVILATLSWMFIETPVRRRRILPRRKSVFVFATCISAVFVAVSVWVCSAGGVPGRLSPAVYRYAEFRNHFAFRIAISADQVQQGQLVELGVTNSTPFDLIVWGDSHAMAVAPVINDLCRRYSLHGGLAAEHSTAPVVSVGAAIGSGKRDDKFPDSVLELIVRRHIKIVIIAARWELYPLTQQFKDNLIFTVRAALESGAKVYVMKDVPRPGFNVPRLVAINAMRGADLNRLGISASQYAAWNKPMDDTFRQLSKIGAIVLDPTPYFVNSHGFYGVVKNDEVLYWDNDHLSVEGAALLEPMFEPIFQTNALRERAGNEKQL